MGATLRVFAAIRVFVVVFFAVVLGLNLLSGIVITAKGDGLGDDWQTSATGLLGQPRESKSTAGLAFTMWQEGWPNLTLPGGVRDGETYQPSILGPVRIDMGEVNVPGATGAFASERADWSMNESVFAYGDQQLKLTTSRLTPAVLVQSSATALNLFAGAVPTYKFDGTKVNSMGDAPSFPKYVAFGGESGAAISAIGAQPTAVPANTRWLLLWYGEQSHFVDTRKPLSYINLPASNAYQADVPMLVLFQTAPTQIQRGAQGGVQLSFGATGGTTSGAIGLMPLYGRQTLPVAQTEAWGAALPAEVLQKANIWAARQCQFPLTAREEYVYDEFADRASVIERFTYQQVCAGAPFAPLPPMLGLAKDGLGVHVDGALISDALPTEFGPLTGIENASSYTWSMTGLADLVRARRVAGNGAVSPELQQALADQVQQIVQAGHLRPWIFIDGVPRHTERGDLYWANPADTLIHLSQAVLALPDGAARNALLGYLSSERTNYPPETQFNLGLQDGAVRPGYTGYWDDWEFQWTQGRADAIQQRVPLWNAYALSQYADVMEEAPSIGTMQTLSAVLDAEMRERDWASMYWFEGFQDRSVAVVNANRHFAGLLGYARLATRAKDIAAWQLALPLLAKAAVLRAGMVLYPRYLYQAQLQELPAPAAAQADWQVQQTAGNWNGYLFNVDWRSGDDDARQVTFLNQYGVYLYDHSGTEGGDASACCFPHPYLTAYRDLTPELAQVLGKLGPTAQVYAAKVKALFPLWYASFAEGTLGHEHNLSHPVDAFQIFLAEAYLGKASGDTLTNYIDIPYLQTGDLFYVQKLAETVLAYRGVTWQGGGVQVAAQPLPDRMADKGEQVRFDISVRPALEPVTETVLVSISVPSGLQYHAGSLQAEAGAVNDVAAPLLTWRGPLPTNEGVTMHFDALVQESQPRWLDVDVWVESPPGQTRLITTSLIVNPVGLYLPTVLRVE